MKHNAKMTRASLPAIIFLVMGLLVGCIPTTSPSVSTPPPTSTPAPTAEIADQPSNRLVLATGEWPPFTIQSIESGGLAIELATAVAEEMDMDIVYEWYPWPRAYKLAQTGEVWGALPYLHNEERAAEMVFSDMLLPNSDSVFFYYKNPPVAEVNEPADLEGLQLGGVRGYFYVEHFDEAGLNYELAGDDVQNIEKLMRGRIDMYPAVEAVGRHYIRTNFPEEVDNFGTLYFPWPAAESEVPGLRVIIPKDDPAKLEKLEAFNEALAEIRKNGTYERIMNKYGLTPN